MKTKSILFLFAFTCLSVKCTAQDTFSIVAVDTVTGEVGSAGASCVDLFKTSLSNDDFIGELFPGVGAINTQAYYLSANQNNAAVQINMGKTSDEIITWLTNNDIQSRPQFRQYGVVTISEGKPTAAAFTGSSTDDFKGHIIGSHYAIQGNILLGKNVLDSMQSRFLNNKGDLACKLMAALQGANMVGADSRCASNGSSSLFAYVKVAQSSDSAGKPSFLVSVRTKNGDRIEPIDSLQKKFKEVHSCLMGSRRQALEEFKYSIYPNPADETIHVLPVYETTSSLKYVISNMKGQQVLNGTVLNNSTIDVSRLKKGTYTIELGSFPIRSRALILIE